MPTINSDVALGLRSSNISVDVFTPEVPSAMDRIRKRNTDKKADKVKQKKKVEKKIDFDDTCAKLIEQLGGLNL